MLVLELDRFDPIVIGEGDNAVVVRLVRVCGVKVKLGFDAALSVPIDRESVRERKLAERARKKAKG